MFKTRQNRSPRKTTPSTALERSHKQFVLVSRMVRKSKNALEWLWISFFLKSFIVKFKGISSKSSLKQEIVPNVCKAKMHCYTFYFSRKLHGKKPLIQGGSAKIENFIFKTIVLALPSASKLYFHFYIFTCNPFISVG